MARPAETVRVVLGFIGEPFDESVLEPEGVKDDVAAPDRGHVFGSSVGRWRRDLSPDSLERVVRIARDRLSELDYLD